MLPLMDTATNGEGRARFYSNLYADGKVSPYPLQPILLIASCIVHDFQDTKLHTSGQQAECLL